MAINYENSSMIPIGYMAKRVAHKPEYLKTNQVEDIFSLSGCISKDFADYINYWKNNGYWLFDSPAIIKEIIHKENIGLDDLTLFYYEAFENEYEFENKRWYAISPDKHFQTNVQIPSIKNFEGFDIVSFSARTSPECSPLSCNCLEETIHVNKKCLLNTFEEAKIIVEGETLTDCEPGPYRIIKVYTVPNWK